jgi:hypothetical protein
VLEATIVEIQKQPTKIEVTQSPNVVITTTRVETIVPPNTNVVRGEILIGFTTNLGCGSGGVSARRNLSQSLGLPITRIDGTPQMVFTNMIMTTHVNRTVD